MEAYLLSGSPSQTVQMKSETSLAEDAFRSLLQRSVFHNVSLKNLLASLHGVTPVVAVLCKTFPGVRTDVDCLDVKDTIKDYYKDSQSLLCREPFISPTPPTSEDREPSSPATSIVFINHNGQVTSLPSLCQKGADNGKVLSLVNLTSPNFRVQKNDPRIGLKAVESHQLLKYHLLEGVTESGEKYKVLVQKDINSNFQSKCANDPAAKFVGNDGDVCQRMSGSNGYDRNRVTGSSTAGGGNESFNRPIDGQSYPGSSRSQVAAAAEGMLMGRVGGTGAVAFHDPGTRSIVTGTAGAGSHGDITGVFRPPHSVTDSGARYGAAPYSSAAASPSSVGPFSPLYTISPYSAFYGNYPGYSIERPSIGSYSAVLQSMGTQAQTHVPRSPFGNTQGGAGNLAQYPLLTVNQSGTGKGYPGVSPGREREDMTYRREQEVDVHRRHSTTGVVKEDGDHHFSVPSYSEPARASVLSILRESPNQKGGAPSPEGQDSYKALSGREGSMKHRILRTSDSTLTSSIRDPQHSAFSNTDEPSPKRTKLETDTDRPGSVDTKEPGAGSSERSSSRPGGRELHYPQHFMKGSIIQLGNGEIKRVEELETNDFIHSADISNDLKIDSSTVVQIEEKPVHGTAVLGFVVGEHKVQVSTEATLEHPFFVFGQGWSSCMPAWTEQRYGLECQKLSVGDVCISLTHKEVSQRAAEISLQQKQQQQNTDGTQNYSFQKSYKRDDLSPSTRRNPTPIHTQGQGSSSYVPQGSPYPRTGLGHGSDASGGPVKADNAFFLSSNQIPSTTKPQDTGTPSTTS